MRNMAVSDMNNLVVIKDNKIVGRVMPYTSRGYCIKVTLQDGEPLTKLKAHAQDGYRHMPLEYDMCSGEYMGSVFVDEDEEASAYFDETRICTEFDLKWALVPDSFKDVEGYGSRRTVFED